MQQETGQPIWFWVALTLASAVTAAVSIKSLLYPHGRPR